MRGGKEREKLTNENSYTYQLHKSSQRTFIKLLTILNIYGYTFFVEH